MVRLRGASAESDRWYTCNQSTGTRPDLFSRYLQLNVHPLLKCSERKIYCIVCSTRPKDAWWNIGFRNILSYHSFCLKCTYSSDTTVDVTRQDLCLMEAPIRTTNSKAEDHCAEYGGRLAIVYREDEHNRLLANS